jgi:hypothetical protein
MYAILLPDTLLEVGDLGNGAPGCTRPVPGIHVDQPVELIILLAVLQVKCKITQSNSVCISTYMYQLPLMINNYNFFVVRNY